MVVNKNVYINNGRSTLITLTLIFLVLKLTGYITWSWFWVLFPSLFPLYIVLGLLAVFAVVTLILTILLSASHKLAPESRFHKTLHDKTAGVMNKIIKFFK